MPTTYITFEDSEEDDEARVALHTKLLSDDLVLEPPPINIHITSLQIIITYAGNDAISMFEMKKNMNRSWEQQMKPLLPGTITVERVEFIDK